MRRTILILLALATACCLLSAAAAEGTSPVIEMFRLTRSTDLPSVTYEILHVEEDWYFCQDAGIPRKIDPALVQEISGIMDRYGMISWDGFDGDEPDVLDGEMFSLSVLLSDGTRISAAGNNAFPDGYFNATGEIDSLLREIPVSPAGALPGEYRYAGEGFGGDFTITISEDRTYTFYEGYLSSYIGMGTWRLEGARLYLEEKESPYYRFVFVPTVDSLFYLADESDAFPYTDVGNLGRFDKLSQENGSIVADLTFRSFAGGGPEYSVRIDDPSVLSCTKYTESESGEEDLDGAPYTVTFTFAGLKAGETGVTILETSPIAGNSRYPFRALVDQWGNVSLTTRMYSGD